MLINIKKDDVNKARNKQDVWLRTCIIFPRVVSCPKSTGLKMQGNQFNRIPCANVNGSIYIYKNTYVCTRYGSKKPVLPIISVFVRVRRICCYRSAVSVAKHYNDEGQFHITTGVVVQLSRPFGIGSSHWKETDKK